MTLGFCEIFNAQALIGRVSLKFNRLTHPTGLVYKSYQNHIEKERLSMATARLDSISYEKMDGPDVITVQLEFLGAAWGPPMTVVSGAGFVSYPPNTTANHSGTSSMDLYRDSFASGELLKQGPTTVADVPPNSTHDYSFSCAEGFFVVKYTALGSVSNHPNTLDNYNHAILLNPNNLVAYYNRGNALYHLGDYQSALADYTQALTLNPNYSDIYNNRGLTRLQLGDPQGAIEDYTQAITLNPDDAKIYSNRGSARNKLGDIKGALEDFTQAIRLNPDYAPAYYNRGVLLGQRGKRRAGMKDFREADALAQEQGDGELRRRVKGVMEGT